MFTNKFFVLFGIILFAIFYKVIPFHPFHWSTGIGVCVFLGATQKTSRALLLSLIVLLTSDCIMQLIFLAGYSSIEGFYHGQILNYILLLGTTLLGRLAYHKKWINLIFAVVGSSVGFFILSNFSVWLQGSMYPMNVAGLIDCYMMGLVFFKTSIIGDVLFALMFFVIYSKYGVVAVSTERKS